MQNNIGEAEVEISVQAYSKMILHAAKYPSRAISGLLLAEQNPGRGSGRRGSEAGGGSGDGGGGGGLAGSRRVLLTDCVPLFHLALPLAPMLEVAFAQLDMWAKEKDLVIAGYYQANESYNDVSPNQVAYKISDLISENYSDAVLIMIENRRMSRDCAKSALHVYHNSGGQWHNKQPGLVCLEPDCLAVASGLLIQRAHVQLMDFDNHLDNPTLDWANPVLNRLILDSC